MENRGRKRPGDLFISEEIVIDIALRLPVKSLMRFKATCKFWNSIISNDPKFAEHRREWIKKPRLLFRPKTSQWRYCIYEVRENGAKAELLQPTNIEKYNHCPFIWPLEYFESTLPIEFKHRSGNLLLFETEETYYPPELYVRDSISGYRILLPDLPRNILLSAETSEPFLMYDVSTKMHKVLVYTRHFDLEDDENDEYIDSCCITSFCNKTMATENVWRTTPSPVGGTFTLPSNTSIKGIMYWLVRNNNHWVEEKFIMPFNIAEEKFLNNIRFPDEISKLKTCIRTYDLLEVRGVLGFMSMTFDELWIWVLTDSDNSFWNLLHKISMKTMFDRPDRFLLRVVFVLEKINCLPSILFSCENKYYWFEMNGMKVEKMKIDKFAANYYDCVSA